MDHLTMGYLVNPTEEGTGCEAEGSGGGTAIFAYVAGMK